MINLQKRASTTQPARCDAAWPGLKNVHQLQLPLVGQLLVYGVRPIDVAADMFMPRPASPLDAANMRPALNWWRFRDSDGRGHARPETALEREFSVIAHPKPIF